MPPLPPCLPGWRTGVAGAGRRSGVRPARAEVAGFRPAAGCRLVRDRRDPRRGRGVGKQRWRITALFVLLEAGMPLLGLAIGAPLARAVGGVADYLAAAALVAVGLWMLFGGDEDTEQDKTRRLLDARGFVMVGLGLSISIDELAIGFSLGLAHLPMAQVVAAIAVQAFIAVQVGWRWVRASVSGGARAPNASPRSPCSGPGSTLPRTGCC